MKNGAVVVEKVIENFVNNELMFTSVDIANAIKKGGSWISNREVAKYLREEYDWMLCGYEKTIIRVTDGKIATLYHPCCCDPINYCDTDKHALTPNEVDCQETLYLYESDISDEKKEDNKKDKDILSREVYCTNRLRIPGIFARKLNWKPGDLVDISKIEVNGLSLKLKVNADYRINIKACLLSRGTFRSYKVVLAYNDKIYIF